MSNQIQLLIELYVYKFSQWGANWSAANPSQTKSHASRTRQTQLSSDNRHIFNKYFNLGFVNSFKYVTSCRVLVEGSLSAKATDKQSNQRTRTP